MVGDDFEKAANERRTLENNSRALAAVLNASPETVDTGKALQIIAAGVEPDMRFDDGNTLLIIAAYAACGDAVCALLEAGANPNIANKRQEVPLHYAAKALLPSAVTALLAHGADIYARDEFGTSVEQCAEKGNCPADPSPQAKVQRWQSVRDIVRNGVDARIKSDMNAALLRDEVKAFTGSGCATRTEVKPMRRIQIKTPGKES